MPPRRFSSCGVGDAADRDGRRRWRTATAAAPPRPDPTTSIFANDVSSNSAAVVRVASASAPIAGLQCSPAQPRGRSASRSAPSATPAPSGVRLEPVRALPRRLLAERRRRAPPAARTPATRAAAARPGAPRSGSGCRSRSRRSRSLRASVYARLRYCAPEAADVHLPQVELGLAVDDPRRHLAADAAGAGDAVGAEPGRDEQPAHVATRRG